MLPGLWWPSRSTGHLSGLRLWLQCLVSVHQRHGVVSFCPLSIDAQEAPESVPQRRSPGPSCTPGWFIYWLLRHSDAQAGLELAPALGSWGAGIPSHRVLPRGHLPGAPCCVSEAWDTLAVWGKTHEVSCCHRQQEQKAASLHPSPRFPVPARLSASPPCRQRPGPPVQSLFYPERPGMQRSW